MTSDQTTPSEMAPLGGGSSPSLSNADRLHRAYRRRRRLLDWIAAGFVVLFAGICFQFTQIWQDYNTHLGASRVAEDWLTRRMSTYSLDSYNMLTELSRVESTSLRFAMGTATQGQLELDRQQVRLVLAQYDPGGILANQMASHASFAPAYGQALAFLDVVRALESGQASIADALKASDEAHKAWKLFTQDAVAQEYKLRDRMEATLVAFRPLAMRTAFNVGILLVVGVLLFVAAVYAVRRLVAEQQNRFRRFEVMVASVGHDLRSPLQAIQSAGSLLGTKLNDADRATYGAVVRSAALRLARMIDDILQVAREENLSWEMRPVQLRQWFREISTTYEHRAKHKGLEFIGVCQTRYPTIQTDPDRLAQCLGNLLDNAIKNTKAGAIKVRLTVSTPPKGSTQTQLMIRVRDTGQGIAKEDQERIFSPFERAASAEMEQGMGLGLSIVANLVRGVGGQIRLGSKVGVGSAFTLILPVQVVKKRASAGTAEVRPSMRAKLEPDEDDVEILIVDDDPAICATLAGVLQEAGFSVDTSSNGDDALRRCLHNNFIAVITDIQMPGIDGFELARRIRGQLERVPFLIGMTAYETRRRPDARCELFDGFLGKPFKDDVLLDLVDRALERGPA